MRAVAVICIALGLFAGWWLATEGDLGVVGWVLGLLTGGIIFGAIRSGWEKP